MFKAAPRPASRAAFVIVCVRRRNRARARARRRTAGNRRHRRSRRGADRPDRRLGDRHSAPPRSRSSEPRASPTCCAASPASTSTKPAASARSRRFACAAANPGETLVLIDGVRVGNPTVDRRLGRFRQSLRGRHRTHRDPARAAVGALRLGRDGRRDQHHHPQGGEDAASLGDGGGRELRHAVDPGDDVGRRRPLDLFARRQRRCTATVSRATAIASIGRYRPARRSPTAASASSPAASAGGRSDRQGRRERAFLLSRVRQCDDRLRLLAFGNALRFDNPCALLAADVFSRYNHSLALMGDAFVRANVDSFGGVLKSQITAFGNVTRQRRLGDGGLLRRRLRLPVSGAVQLPQLLSRDPLRRGIPGRPENRPVRRSDLRRADGDRDREGRRRTPIPTTARSRRSPLGR